MSRLAASIAVALASLAAPAACVSLGQDADARTTINPPAGGVDGFKPVGRFLVHRCGSLDCHGEVGRNLRLYGEYGLRLDAGDVPSGGLTTDDEYDADYQSVVSLEPEIMNQIVAEFANVTLSAVIDDPSANPASQLTLFRKPTGIEAHKGGMLIFPGDPSTGTPADDQAHCLTSWLASAVDMTACQNAADPSKYP